MCQVRRMGPYDIICMRIPLNIGTVYFTLCIILDFKCYNPSCYETSHKTMFFIVQFICSQSSSKHSSFLTRSSCLSCNFQLFLPNSNCLQTKDISTLELVTDFCTRFNLLFETWTHNWWEKGKNILPDFLCSFYNISLSNDFISATM